MTLWATSYVVRSLVINARLFVVALYISICSFGNCDNNSAAALLAASSS